LFTFYTHKKKEEIEMAGRPSGIGAEERTLKRVLISWFTLVLSAVMGIALAYHFHYKIPSPANHNG
jgi:hypothetical protein